MVHPRKGQLEALYHIFSYLKHHERCSMVFDDTYVQFNKNDFVEFDWIDFYGDVTEHILHNAPKARGNPMQMTAFVDAIVMQVTK
jgi:hypothetical protein